MSYLESLNIFTPHQYGFRRGSSTAHAALWLVNAIHSQIGAGQHCGVAFVDIKNAFPSVDHQILFKKLEHYGIRGYVLQWLESFVSGRSMHVFNKVASATVTTTRGVPQGSALGPLLFLIYYNDVVASVSCRSVLFADDTALLVSSASLSDASRELNVALGELSNYFQVNKLLLNVRKTECLFPYEDIESVPPVEYDTHRLTVVSSFKYLGAHIDQMFTWKAHEEHIISKVKTRIYMMYRSRYCCSAAGRKLLFTAMILPHFWYCIEVWRACSQTLSGAVEVLYRHCMRIVLNDTGFMPSLTNSDLYDKIDLLPLYLEFQFRTACLLFSAVKLDAIPNLRGLFLRKVTHRVTRDSDDEHQLQIPFTRSERERSAICWWGCILWSRVPVGLRNVASLKEFRLEYMHYLLCKLNANVNLNRKFYDFV